MEQEEGRVPPLSEAQNRPLSHSETKQTELLKAATMTNTYNKQINNKLQQPDKPRRLVGWLGFNGTFNTE